MKLQSVNLTQLRQDVAKLDDGSKRPIDANAARLIQLTQKLELPKGLSQADSLEMRATALGEALPIELGRMDLDAQALLAAAGAAQTALTSAARISRDQTARLEQAIELAEKKGPVSTPSPEVVAAFLKKFEAVGIQGAQRDTHNDWYVNMGPGSGKTFCFTPSRDAIEARAGELAAKKGVPVADKHRLAAADELAKEQKVKFGEDKDAPGAAGRVFGAPYEVLEAVGGYGLAKVHSNNAESVKAGITGLLASGSGKDVAIDQSLDAAGYKKALAEKLGEDGTAAAPKAGGRSWVQLGASERAHVTDYMSSLLGEFAELKLGRRSYEELSPAAKNTLSTTHDVYVQMRASWLFEDGWGKTQAVPFDKLSKELKDADIPPFLFALSSMVDAACLEVKRDGVATQAQTLVKDSSRRLERSLR